MAEHLTISPANLSSIESNLSALAEGIDRVTSKVEVVAQEVSTTQDQVARLAEDFHAFVQADVMAKEWQRAKTEIVEVRQKLEKDFGYHDEVRRLTSGILQAVDLSIVRENTIKGATEEMMLKAPRYWLAPGLVALSAWLSDNRTLAERAMMEAVKRDDNKASLYFALIARRGSRRQASGSWLQRFFSLQDPTDLDRELVVLIDAVASGIFGAEGRGFCVQQFELWLKELSERVGFAEQQRDQWANALASKAPSVGADEYAYLRKYSPDWNRLDTSLRGSRLHDALKSYFEGIFTGELRPASSLSDEIDAMLDKLVSPDFDDEALPLRRELELLELINKERGDRVAAERRFQAVKQAFEQKVTFTQLVTNAAMHPEIAGASKATQRFATAMSRDWIVTAHDDLTAQNRAGVPTEIPFRIEGWDGKTRDGQNESELVSAIDSHLRAEETKRVATIVLNPVNWVALLLGGIVGLYGLITLTWFLVILGLGAVGWYFYAKHQVETNKGQIHQHYENLRDTSPKILKGVLAEVVDWRKDFSTGDAKAEELRKYLQSITTEQHMLTQFETGRAVINRA